MYIDARTAEVITDDRWEQVCKQALTRNVNPKTGISHHDHEELIKEFLGEEIELKRLDVTQGITKFRHVFLYEAMSMRGTHYLYWYVAIAETPDGEKALAAIKAELKNPMDESK